MRSSQGGVNDGVALAHAEIRTCKQTTRRPRRKPLINARN
jgi:hypothetical protein